MPLFAILGGLGTFVSWLVTVFLHFKDGVAPVHCGEENLALLAKLAHAGAVWNAHERENRRAPGGPSPARGRQGVGGIHGVRYVVCAGSQRRVAEGNVGQIWHVVPS